LLFGKRIYDLAPGPRAPAVSEDFPSKELLNELKDIKQRELLKKMLKKDSEERLGSKQVLDILRNKRE
jgi:hypothetical protein